MKCGGEEAEQSLRTIQIHGGDSRSNKNKNSLALTTLRESFKKNVTN